MKSRRCAAGGHVGVGALIVERTLQFRARPNRWGLAEPGRAMKQITVASKAGSERLRNFKGRNDVKTRARRPVGCGTAEMERRLEGFRVVRCTLKGESLPFFWMRLRPAFVAPMCCKSERLKTSEHRFAQIIGDDSSTDFCWRQLCVRARHRWRPSAIQAHRLDDGRRRPRQCSSAGAVAGWLSVARRNDGRIPFDGVGFEHIPELEEKVAQSKSITA